MAFTQQQMDAMNGYSSAVTPDQSSKAYSHSNNFVQQMVAATSQPQPEQKQPSTFFSPGQNIASGNAQDNSQHSIGAFKQIASDVLGTGPQSPNNPDSPIGKVIFANAPAFANDVRGLDSALIPSNPMQKQGSTDTSIAETAIPIPGARIPGKVFEGIGQKIGEAFIPTSEKEAGMLQNYKAGTTFAERIGSLLSGDSKAPTTAASAAFNKGLMGTESMMGVQAQRAQGRIWTNMLKPALQGSPEQVKISDIFSNAEQKIISDNADPTRRNALMTALNSIKEDFGNISTVGMEQLQKYKEGWAKFVPQKAYKGEDISGALNDVRNMLAGTARDKIYSSLGDAVKQAYLDYGNLNGIIELGIKSRAGSKLKGGAGSMLHGLYEMATVPIGTVGGQTLYKVGQGLEFAGGAGARTLGEVLGLAQQGASQNVQDQQ